MHIENVHQEYLKNLIALLTKCKSLCKQKYYTLANSSVTSVLNTSELNDSRVLVKGNAVN